MPTDTPRVRHILGCMTGTSLDGLDVALTRVTGTGLSMAAEFLGLHSAPLPGALRETLMSLASGNAHPPLDIMRAARHLGVVHAEACALLIAQHPDLSPNADQTSGGVDFVVAHGQTIWHAPADGLSWQLFDPWPLVHALRLPVCYDLRQADLVAGGQGAPITPIADPILYRFDQAVVLNLGGICNYTHWSGPTHSLRGGDLGPCNLLIDAAVRELFQGKSFDEDGQLTQGVNADPSLTARWVDAINSRRAGATSLGREQFGGAWVRETLRSMKDDSDPRITLASIIAAVARCIAGSDVQFDFAGDEPMRGVLAGGGARNRRLADQLRGALGSDVVLSDDLGIPCEAREAMAFAVLGALSQDGVPITLPAVMGSDAPGVAGCWVYP